MDIRKAIKAHKIINRMNDNQKVIKTMESFERMGVRKYPDEITVFKMLVKEDKQEIASL